MSSSLRRVRVRWGFVLALAACGCGSRVPQSAPCQAWVACLKTLDAQAGTTTNYARYAPDGECWGNSEIAELCTTSCERALERDSQDFTLPAECKP